jgi:hypothetical protein
MRDGKIINSQPSAFARRKIPPGSIIKLFAAWYMFSERPGIIENHRIRCRGKMPGKKYQNEGCWFKDGHGDIGIEDALALSCNEYFASLERYIEEQAFMTFMTGTAKKTGMMPSFIKSTQRSWPRVIAGLENCTLFSADDYIRIAMLFSGKKCVDEKIENARSKISRLSIDIMESGLKKTFTIGTASPKTEAIGTEINQLSEADIPKNSKDTAWWGKTATLLDGTNQPKGHGIFIGGRGNTGIVVIIRSGNGHLASMWARMLYHQFIEKDGSGRKPLK